MTGTFNDGTFSLHIGLNHDSLGMNSPCVFREESEQSVRAGAVKTISLFL